MLFRGQGQLATVGWRFVQRVWRYRDRDGLADPERDWRFSSNLDADGKTLREPDPINGLIDRRQQTGGRSAGAVLHKDSPGDAFYRAFKRRLMVAHERHFHGSPGPDRDKLSFLKVSGDPE